MLTPSLHLIESIRSIPIQVRNELKNLRAIVIIIDHCSGWFYQCNKTKEARIW